VVDKAALSYSSPWLYQTTEGSYLRELSQPKNWTIKLEFLDRLWTSLPNHDLCIGCTTVHLKDATARSSKVQIMKGVVAQWKEDGEGGLKCHFPVKDHIFRNVGDWSCYNEWPRRYRDGQNDFSSQMIVIRYERPLPLTLTHNTVTVELPSCSHNPDCIQLRDHFRKFKDDAPRPWQPDRIKSKYASDVYRCCRCPSEFLFIVKPYDDASLLDRATHQLHVIHVTDLGPERTVHNRCWKALTSKANNSNLSTDPFPLASLKPLMHYALNRPDERSVEYKSYTLAHFKMAEKHIKTTSLTD